MSCRIITLLLTVSVLLLLIAETNGSKIQPVTTAKILDATAALEFNKIETRVYKDPTAVNNTYIICNLMLGASGEVIFAERSFTGSGLNGETIQNFPNDTYIDIDVVDSINLCRYVALTNSGYLIMPDQQSIPATNFSVIEATTFGNNETVVVLCKPDTTIVFPAPPFNWPSLYNCKTLDVVYNNRCQKCQIRRSIGFVYNNDFDTEFDNVIYTARHDGLLETPDPVIIGLSNGTAFIALQGLDDAFPGGGANPSFAVWPNGNYVLCGEGKGLTIICSNQYTYAEVIWLRNTSEYYYSNPIISSLDNSLFALSALKTYYNGSAGEYTLLVMNQLFGVLTSYTKSNVKVVTQRAIDGYIFVTYFTNETLSMDVLQYTTNPPVVTPVPVSPTPVATPALVPSTTPSELPTPSVSDSPKSTPLAAQGLSQEATIAIGVVLSVVGAGLVIFFIIFFTRRNKKAKAKKEQKKMEDEDKTKYEAIQLVNPVALTNTTSSSSGMFDAESIDKRLKIPYKRLKFIKEIGSGSYGKVFYGEWRGATVAIKVNNQIADIEGFLHEAKLTLGIAPHPNLVQTFGVSLDGPNPCIVLEHCGGGSLDKIVFNKNTKLTNQKRKDYALKIAYGLLHLHQNNIVHRDLAARNILLTTDGEPKITDFGMSRIISDDSSQGKTKQTVGPMRWMAPESLVDQTYSFKSDVWTYGILVYELVAGEEPHDDEDQLYIGAMIRDEAYTPEIPKDCDPALRHVMEICWKKDPRDRPFVEEIVDYLQNN